MSGTWRSGGRGGAGNFVSQKDVDAAEKARRDNDLEAQKTSSPPPLAPPPSPPQHAIPPPQQQQQQQQQYVRTGRGGAGNFAEPPTAAEARDGQDVVDRARAAVGASHAGQPGRAALSGRGGAGNWAGDGDGSGEQARQQQQQQQQMADQIVHDIDASLAPPPRTYHQHDRDMEK